MRIREVQPMENKPMPFRGHFFPLPAELFLLDLSANEIAVYAYLMSIENRRTYQCWASYGTIGRAVGLSENTVRKNVHLLEEKKLIHTERTKVKTRDGQTHNGCLLYTIRPIQDAVDHYTYKQYSLFDQERAAQEAAQRIADYNRQHPEKPVCATIGKEAG